ncbi:MAG: ShlB/FhaC/HecB family hemolysin secretion/activation protein [Betaproteobacteria bacterium]|nr:ShlB/FhaC/HecB family hemolysin secretion/activation protein [Betaproteobacteria bacterium]
MTALRRLLLAVALVVTANAAFAQDAAIPAPKFDIQRYEVVGDTILGAETVQRLVTPHTGKQKDFGDVQRALEALEGAYRALGYGVVQVQLPEQDITRGVVRFNIAQPKIGKVTVEGNEHFSSDNVRRSLPSVKEGETPNSDEIARNLQLTGEHPVKQTSVLLRSGANEGLVDVNVRVKDEKPWRLVGTLDNTGTSETGELRLGIGYQHSNLFDRDHVLSLQYITSPTDLDQVSIYGAGYRIPYYRLNSSLDVYAGYSNVDSGTVGNLFAVSGKGNVAGGRWNYYLPKWQDVEHKAYLGLDYRAFQNNVTLGGVGFVPDITIRPASIGYAGLKRFTASQWAFNGAISSNIPGGNDGEQRDFDLTRFGATANYNILRAGTSFAHAFSNDWQGRIAWQGQYTDDLLIPGEQFGIGGPDSVRGYLPREVANDKGYSAQLEVFTPDFAAKAGLTDKWRTRVIGFYDFGDVRRNNPLPGESAGQYLASTGLGLRLSYGKSVNLRFDVAQILKAYGTRQTDDQRISANIAIIY